MDEVLSLNQQIAELEKKRAEVERKNRPVVLADIRAKMQAYKITVQELTSPPPKAKKVKVDKEGSVKPAKAVKVKKATLSLPIRFKGPEEGQNWSGRGQPPRWMRELIAAGRKKEEFVIPTTAAGESSPSSV